MRISQPFARAKYVVVFSLVILTAFLLIAKSATISVPTGTWVSGGAMSQARDGSSAALLNAGRVLIIGGSDASGATTSVDAFDAGGSFSPAAPLSTPRTRHSSVVLSDGRVLVAGGWTSGGGVTNSAEIYDPTTNSWSSVAGGMIEARVGHTASLLADGRVLLAGGESGSTISQTAEIFDPVTNSFSFAGTLSTPRKDHAAAVLADGRVLIIGGSDGNNLLASSDLFDPASGSVSVGPALSFPRSGHSATTLLDGNVLVAGGNNGANDLSSAELYDAATGSFSPVAGTLSSPRRGHLAFLLPNNNSVLILGGTSSGVALASAEVYVPWSGAFQPIAFLSAARAGATGTALQQDGVLLIAGGSGQSSSELYGFATVKTDMGDYAPGDTVTVTGSGWQPGETVTLKYVESPVLDTHGPYTVVADSFGNIFDQQFIPDHHDLNIRFYLTAAGASSQAQTTFTDAARCCNIGSVSVGSQVGTLTAGTPGSVSFPVTVNRGTSTGGFNAALSVVSGLPAGATASFPSNCVFQSIITPSCIRFQPTDNSLTTNLIVTTSASTPGGSFTLTVTAYDQDLGIGPTTTTTLIVNDLGSISGTVYSDSNTNSVLDGGEPGIGGVTVTLTDCSNNPVSTTSTAANGTYSFTGLAAGCYKVSSPATANGEALETTSPLTVNLSAGQNSTGNNFGYITGSIAGTVYTDSNTNSVLDGGEPGIGGVTVTLTDCSNNPVSTTSTAANGTYSFSGLAAGCYKVSSPTTASGESLETTSPLTVNLAAGQNSTGNNFGYILGSIAGTVYTDSNTNSVLDGGEPGIGGVTVTLTDCSNNPVSTTSTAANGTYSFTGLAAGCYKVSSPATANGESLETTSPLTVNLAAGQNSTGNNFGYITGSIGDRVWNDQNGNGVQDGGEPGLVGVTVTLKDSGNNMVGTQVTGANGIYTFSGLTAGTYTVCTSNVPAGFAQTFDLDGLGTPNCATATLTAGQGRTDVDFGYQERDASIGDRVWNDLNGNGVQDGGEPGLVGVTVTLKDSGNNVVGTQTTGANGIYTFSGLAAGTYTVCTSNVPAGFVQTFDLDGLGTPNCATASLAAGQNRTDVDFGYRVTPLQLACPSGTTGQVGVPYSSTAAFSGGVGPYVFSVASGSLPPGLTLNPATGAITGTPTAGGTFVFTLMVTDSLGSTAISSCSGSCSSTSITWDFATPSGLLGTSQSYTVSGISVTAYGFSNAGAPKALYGNNRGVDESGLGINGTAADNEIDTANFVQLDLNNLINRGATNLQMTIESVQATEAYNVYGSNTLGVIGTALITNSTVDNTPFTVPQFGLYRYVSVRATALDVLLGTISATLPPGCTITITGFGSIAGTVYTDTNTNSLLDNGEPGIGGVTVTLNGPGGTKTTTTASNGTYLFSNLVAGNYTVSSPPTANGQTLETTSPLSVALAAGQNKTGVNFGYISPFCTPTTTTIVNDFNSSSIGSGKTLWFSGELNPSGTITKLTHISVTNASIVFNVGTTNYTIPVPNALITLDPSATSATTTFDVPTQTWKTTVPANISGDIFMAGVALPLPSGLPGSVDDVSWSAQMSADTPGVTVVWKWSATAFSSFNTNYNSLGIKPVDDSTKSVYKNSDTAGTPENYKNNTVSGGTGTNATCNKSHVITATVALCKNSSCKYTTYTQGFWHNSNGLNLLNLGWSSVYGSNVKIGGNKTLTFTSPSYTSRFLPQGGAPGYLTFSSTNPTSSSSNVFGGQVLTLQLNVDYSSAGITTPGLLNLKFNYGPLAGYNVGQILAMANAVMGGNLAALPPGVSISALNDAVDKINNNFDSGTINNGFLF